MAFWRAGSTSSGRVAFTLNTDLAGDGELGGVFAVLPKQVREEAAACVDEPVTYLGKEERFRTLIQLVTAHKHSQKNKMCSLLLQHLSETLNLCPDSSRHSSQIYSSPAETDPRPVI